MANGSTPFFHILPWVIFIISILMLIFFIFSAYYGYQTGKIAGVSGFESTTLLIFSIIFALLMVFLFIWSIVHLFRLYSGKKEDKKTITKDKEVEEPKPTPAAQPVTGRRVQVVSSNSDVNNYSKMNTTPRKESQIEDLLRSSNKNDS